MLNEENLISTLEQSLRQFDSAKERLRERLKVVEVEIINLQTEAKHLKDEIDALDQSAVKTREALESLLTSMRKISNS